ncbi:acyltransferase [Nakamurella silvestris]|nr:acyltransferase [Nakamurella silvestris]
MWQYSANAEQSVAVVSTFLTTPSEMSRPCRQRLHRAFSGRLPVSLDVRGEETTPPGPDRETPTSTGRWRAGELDMKSNSLNLIRLILAGAVIVHHVYPLGGFSGAPTIDGVQFGGWAVFGFFTISGYLISSTRTRNTIGNFLVHRVARIYPGFWICLIITAGVFAPIAQLVHQGNLDGFLTTKVTPVDYFLRNFTLNIGSFSIGTTLADNPFPHAWNGSLWTLYYEFLCYVLVGGLFCLSWWRKQRWLTPVLFVAAVALSVRWSSLEPYVGGNVDLKNLLQLLPYFLAGSALYRYRKELPLHWIGAVISAVLIVGALKLSAVWGLQAAAPALAYLLLWLGQVVPAPRWITRNDLSYGVYIYAFPVQQLLAGFGLPDHGAVLYFAVTVAITLPLAAASWFLVERPVIRSARARTARKELVA